jgi:hypothetical protein
MKTIFKDGRAQLLADDGKIITNGVDVYGYDITLAMGADSSAYHEISVSEYEAKIASEMSDSIDKSDFR